MIDLLIWYVWIVLIHSFYELFMRNDIKFEKQWTYAVNATFGDSFAIWGVSIPLIFPVLILLLGALRWPLMIWGMLKGSYPVPFVNKTFSWSRVYED